MRVLIVDDEPLARRGVAVRLRKFPDIEIVGECSDGSSAVKRILNLSPDLVFLDVQMPELNGFDVLRALPKDRIPGVIFLTAYEQHALRAFEVHAIDYLLKPIDDARFESAIHRARRQTHSASQAQLVERLLGLLDEKATKYLSQFAVRTGSRIQVILAADVEWIAAAGDYSELHARGRAHLLRETMNSLEQKLDPANFMRIHRSRIVRSSSIVELRSIENREYLVKLADGSEHRSSRTYADRLEQWLHAGKTQK
ncbi:MAG TPA: LytTR family DNA-binding domain-containing protein [Candidatus Sulfotelmatobacter sp.]|nr:LytTR family DNA-binding domain-containing protein [Candidatus Sulfotelmatobacter sp.]